MKSFSRLSCGAILAAALSFTALPTQAAQPDDAWVTTRVKMALLTDDVVDGLAVDVDTFDGRVTLHGQVDSAAQRDQAEALARRVPGVSDVRNLLAIVPPSAREAFEVSDDALAAQVKTVLERDEALAGSDISVKSVHDGVVVLDGRAKTLSAHRRALEDARAVRGVRQVASEIRSPDQLADEEIWEGSARPGAGEELASATSDAWITTKVKMHLIGEPGLSPFAVDVDTRHGVVTLFGTVASDDAKTRAGAQVREVSGVKGVENDLQVVPESAEKSVAAADDRVRETLRRRLGSRDSLDDADIVVAVKNGVVRLTGTVASQGDRLTALTLARSTEGVGSVIDGLEVKRPSG